MHELRELSRGIHPAVLTRGGLTPALKVLERRSAVRVTLDIHLEHRLPDQVEVAAYFTVSEALTNASRHANATRTWVSLRVEDDTLLLSIRDDGVGGADASQGSGPTGSRIESKRSEDICRSESPPGRGTLIAVAIPSRGRTTETASGRNEGTGDDPHQEHKRHLSQHWLLQRRRCGYD